MCFDRERRRALGHPGELLEIEGITAAVVIEGGNRRFIDARSDEFGGLVARERVKLDLGKGACTARWLERHRQALRCLLGPQGQDEEHCGVGRPAEQRSQQVDRGGVGPVDVVQHEHERADPREPFEELANGAMASVALVPECGAFRGRKFRERGEDVGESVPDIIVQCVEATRLEAVKVLVERVHEHPEGKVALKLRGGSGEDEMTCGIRAVYELGQKPRFSDARFADDLDSQRPAAVGSGKKIVERAELLGASDQVFSNGHCVLRNEDRSGLRNQEIRGSPRCPRRAGASGLIHDPVPAPPSPRAA